MRAAILPSTSLIVCAIVACGTTGPTDDSLDADDLPALELVEEVRIGSIDNPDVGFSRVTAVDVDRDGLIYVLERQEPEIRVYDRAGQRVGTIGGPGEGPGEFLSPTVFGVLGDTVWVSDSRLRRMTLFTREGELLSTIDANGVSIPTPAGISVTVRPGRLLPNRLIEGARLMAFGIGIELPEDVIVPELLFDLNGNVVDTVSLDTIPARAPFTLPERMQVGAIAVTKPTPPSDGAYVQSMEHGSVTVERPHATSADDAFFTVTRTTADADTSFLLRFRYEPRPYDGPVVDNLVEARAQSYEARAGDDYEAVKNAIRDAWELPPFQSPISLVHVATDDALWIRRQDEGGDTYEWIVIDAGGAALGRARLPRDAVIEWATAREAWVVERDEYDVQWLVHYANRSGHFRR